MSKLTKGIIFGLCVLVLVLGAMMFHHLASCSLSNVKHISKIVDRKHKAWDENVCTNYLNVGGVFMCVMYRTDHYETWTLYLENGKTIEVNYAQYVTLYVGGNYEYYEDELVCIA